jgi:IS4 transposase
MLANLFKHKTEEKKNDEKPSSNVNPFFFYFFTAIAFLCLIIGVVLLAFGI